MRFSSPRLKLWFGTADSPAPQGEVPAGQPLTVMIAVEPANPNNRVEIRYRVNRGVQRVLRTSVANAISQMQTQFFLGQFPPFPQGVAVEYAPLLSNIKETLDSLIDGAYPATFSVSPPTPAKGIVSESSDILLGRFPFRLELIFSITCRLHAELIGDTPDGLRYDFFIEEGTLNGPLLRGRFLREGGDWMRVRRDGVGIPDIRVTFLLNDGVKILMESGGWFDFGPDGYENAKRGIFPTSGNLITQPSFFTSDPRYTWLMRAHCFGVGNVDLNSFTVRDDVYRIIRPEGSESS